MLIPPNVDSPKRVTPGYGFGFRTAYWLLGTLGAVTAKTASASESFNPTTLISSGSIQRLGSFRKMLIAIL